MNKSIIGVETTVKARLNKSRTAFARFLIGKKFIDIGRIGKLLIFVLSKKGNYLLVHLKMTGQLIYRQGEEMIAGGHSDPWAVESPNNYTRVVFVFADKSTLYFNDLRRFGYLHLVDGKELLKIRSKYGIEPLAKEFTLENFLSCLQNKKTSIKSALLNQRLFAGIGNIYADESCFLAGIRPTMEVSKLTGAQANKLHRSIESVIRKSISNRGTTFNSYVDSDGLIGGFKKLLNVYGRAGEKCRRCKAIVKKIKLSGRGTHFCPGCQK